jgi:two-component system nitrogen regulation response regulator GlnG
VKTSPHARRDRKGILVVDDERLIRWSIREALRGQYRVWTAESAERALRMLHRLKHVHGLLVDIRLPGASGYELIAQVRALCPDLKVFIMSGYDKESGPRQAFSVRADGYLSKPFLMETLKDMLVSHLMTLPPRAEKYLRIAGNP